MSTDKPDAPRLSDDVILRHVPSFDQDGTLARWALSAVRNYQAEPQNFRRAGAHHGALYTRAYGARRVGLLVYHTTSGTIIAKFDTPDPEPSTEDR